jgi:hypothetical protein
MRHLYDCFIVVTNDLSKYWGHKNKSNQSILSNPLPAALLSPPAHFILFPSFPSSHSIGTDISSDNNVLNVASNKGFGLVDIGQRETEENTTDCRQGDIRLFTSPLFVDLLSEVWL